MTKAYKRQNLNQLRVVVIFIKIIFSKELVKNRITSKFNLFYISTNFFKEMNVKLDTKEKFTVISPIEAIISANMTVELQLLLQTFFEKTIPHVILNLSAVKEIDEESLQMIVEMQQKFYNDNFSFVLCELNESIIISLEGKDMLDSMNITPTESEAWDIVQMEEIERELLSDFNDN